MISHFSSDDAPTTPLRLTGDTPESIAAIQRTLGSREWTRNNRHHLADLFPLEWTPSKEFNWLALRFRLKLLGIDYRSEETFVECFTFLIRIGLVETHVDTPDSTYIRRPPILPEL